MKKLLTTLTFSCIGLLAFCQQVPENASLVIKYNGEKFDASLPIEKVNQYKFIQSMIQKEMDYNGLFPLDRAGIDFAKTSLQYLLLTDSALNFVTQIEIKNLGDFLALVRKNYKSDLKTVRKDNFEYLKISNDKYLGWNEKNATLIYTTAVDKKADYYYLSYDAEDSLNLIVDSMVDARRAAKKFIEDKPAKVKKEKGKKTKKEDVIIPPPMDPWAEEDWVYQLRDSVFAAASDQWYREKDSLNALKKRVIALEALTTAFSTKNKVAVSNLPGYNEVVDNNGHVNVWFNYGSLHNQFINRYLESGFMNLLNSAGMKAGSKPESGYIIGLNLFFEQEQIRVNQLTYAPNKALESLSKQVYKSRQSKSLAGYINPDNLGFLSVSVNSEAMMHYYYKALKDYFGQSIFAGEYGDLINLYVDLMEISIDEKALSKLAPGNIMFVLHSLAPKEVTFKTYEYDEEFNSKEVIKTKTELAPDFTFAMSTERPDFMKRLIEVPMRYAHKGGFGYTENEGYHTLEIGEENGLIKAIYFVVKKDRVVVTTSKEVVENTLAEKYYTLSKENRKQVFSNNYAGVVNTQEVLKAIGPEFSTENNRKIRKLLEENLGNMVMESQYRNGMVHTNFLMKIKGNHKNSFEFLFNITDAIKGIEEAETAEKETAFQSGVE